MTRRYLPHKPRGLMPRILSGNDFADRLLTWYGKNKRDLPWRRTKDPYKIWVSEVMLQQTTVNTVMGYYQRFIKNFATMHDLAAAPMQKVLKEWQGLGYYQRAKNMRKAARIMVRGHKGLVPKNPEILHSLPGFGPYTTAAVLSIAYDSPMTVIDVNVRRVIMRLLGIEGGATLRQDNKIKTFLNAVMPCKKVGDFNQALMELGALVCRSQNPGCIVCPMIKHCRAQKEGKQGKIPHPNKKIIKHRQAVAAVIKKSDYFFIQKRPSQGLWADLWEFPNGMIKTGESKPQALRRLLTGELKLKLASHRPLLEIKHFYTQFKVRLSVFECSIGPKPRLERPHQWIKYKDFSKYPMPSVYHKIIENLRKRKRKR